MCFDLLQCRGRQLEAAVELKDVEIVAAVSNK
jgi:hypothetical protein